MSWEVEFTDEFKAWWNTLTEDQQEDVRYSVGLLEEVGPSLGFPHTSKINGSHHGGMRELRTQSREDPSERYMCSTLGAPRFFSSAATKPETTGGTPNSFRLPIVSTMSIWTSLKKKGDCNADAKI